MSRILLASLAVVAAASHAFAQSCAMCGSSFGPDDPVQRAFSWSILFLMAVPYTLFGSVAGWLFFKYRRTDRRRASVVHLPWASSRPAGETGGH